MNNELDREPQPLDVPRLTHEEFGRRAVSPNPTDRGDAELRPPVAEPHISRRSASDRRELLGNRFPRDL